MENQNDIKHILWDFDGVIMDSMSIRDIGFELIFKKFPKKSVNELLRYHRINGGLSRYVKIRYFFEEILNRNITEREVLAYAEEFSITMLSRLIDKKMLIKDSVDFIASKYLHYDMHVVSGSDQTELRKICKGIDIEKYFRSIHGSPTSKKENVKNVILSNNYRVDETCLIGDSINDYEAAVDNKIQFLGYNNEDLKDMPEVKYLSSFKEANELF